MDYFLPAGYIPFLPANFFGYVPFLPVEKYVPLCDRCNRVRGDFVLVLRALTFLNPAWLVPEIEQTKERGLLKTTVETEMRIDNGLVQCTYNWNQYKHELGDVRERDGMEARQ
jgi:hypothetical protein